MKRQFEIKSNISKISLSYKNINTFGIIENKYYKYIHKCNFKNKTYEFYNLIDKYYTEIIFLECWFKDTLTFFFIKNNKLHSINCHAYNCSFIKKYYINGEYLTKEDWIKHPLVIASKRKTKLKNIFQNESL